MRQFGLIGFPLSHSFSQKYFNEKFIKEKIESTEFLNFEIDDIKKLHEVLKLHPQLSGFAVTIPYKKSIIQFLAAYNDAVKSTAACNCVKISNNNLTGFNTDVIGFVKSFKKHLQPHHTKALILGTGGAAAAVEYVLKKINIDYRFVARNTAQENMYSYEQLNKKIIEEHTVIINCTPLGMFPNIEEKPAIPYGFLTAKHYLFDLIYNPAKTKFLSLGEKQGATIKNGYEMLIIQAEENWKIWNDSL